MAKEIITIIIHYDEISLKGKNQGFFIKHLLENIKQITKLEKEVKLVGKQICLFLEEEKVADCVKKLQFISGIATILIGHKTKTDLLEIKKASLHLLEKYQPKSFKIETTRSFKQFPLNSPEVSSEVGSYIFENYDNELIVDVHNPDMIIKIEIAKKETFVLGNKIKGIGGLPIGATGKIICLLSGGIDSPVAAFQMMKRGAKVVFVHFHNQTINKTGVESKINKLVQRLSCFQGESELYIVPFAQLQQQVIAQIPSDKRMIVYRRLMFKIAERLALKIKASALVTGDSLAQVASQTMENIQVIYNATDMLKFAPLIGMNKVEIMDIARLIKTYEISTLPYEDCCSLMIAKHPETRGQLADILELEKGIDVESLINGAMANLKLVKIIN